MKQLLDLKNLRNSNKIEYFKQYSRTKPELLMLWNFLIDSTEDLKREFHTRILMEQIRIDFYFWLSASHKAYEKSININWPMYYIIVHTKKDDKITKLILDIDD